MPLQTSPFVHVYKASAGSGKTFTLVVHYLTILLQSPLPNTFKNVLAVTFTNKATAEMKQRILEQLYGIGHNLAESNTYVQAIQAICPLDENVIRERASKILLVLIHEYNYFSVKTIDTFFKQIVGNIALELGLPSGFQVDVDDKTFIDEAVDEIFDNVQPNTKLLNLILQFMDERLSEDKKWDIRKELKAFSKMNLFSEKYMTQSDLLEDILTDETKIQFFYRQLKEIREDATLRLKGMAKKWKEALDTAGISESDFSYGKQAFSSYFQAMEQGTSKECGVQFQKKLEAPESWVKKTSKNKEALLELVSSSLLPLLQDIESNRIRCEQDLNSVSLSLQHFNSLRLLASIDETVKALTQEQNRYMLARIPILIHSLIDDSDAPFILEKAGNRYKHILIDEFQDTSIVQWDNFKTLLINSLSQGGTCLLVGDVKQSIYRWRGSDWRNLQSIDTQFPGQCKVENLTTNFRSESEIINFNNYFFSHVSHILKEQLGDMEKTLTEIYSDVEQKSRREKSSGYVSIKLYDQNILKQQQDASDSKSSDSPQDILLNDLGAAIDDVHQKGLPYHKMIILTRTGNDMDKIISFFNLHYPHIPIISEEAFTLKSSIAVKIIISVLQALKDPKNCIAPTFIVYQYYNLIKKLPLTIVEAARNSEERNPLNLKGKRDEYLKMPLFELIETIIVQLELHTLKGQDAYIHSFTDEVMDYLNNHIPDLSDFLSYWEETLANKKIASSSQNGLRILTIHKSKGLEAHTVFIPLCHWPLFKDKGNLWCSPTVEPYNTLPIISISKDKRMEKSIYREDYLNEHKQEIIESLNLLYVAFTRSKTNLFVQGLCSSGSDDIKSTALLIRAVLPDNFIDGISTYEKGELDSATSDNSIHASDTPFTSSKEEYTNTLHVYNSPMLFQQSNESFDFTHPITPEKAHQSEYIIKGNLLHKLFSSIHYQDDIERVLLQYEQQGIFEARTTVQEMRRIIEYNFKNPTIKNWFSKDWNVYTECNILSHSDGDLQIRRPDRVLTKNNDAVVIDLKFGTEHKEYHKQVGDYVTLLQNMGYKHVKGYLWFVYSGKIVEV